MKKFLLLFFGVLLFSISLSAQRGSTDKGVILIKGSSDMNLTLSEDFPIDLSIGGGYFIKNNICLGADVSLLTAKDEEDKLNLTLALEPFGRYYFKEKFFGGIGAFKFGEDWKLKLQGGYLFYLTDLIVIEPVLEYPIVDNSNLQIKVGISIYY
jgi:hypothetical protein